MSFVDDESNGQSRLDGYVDDGPDYISDAGSDDDEGFCIPFPFYDPVGNPYPHFDPDVCSNHGGFLPYPFANPYHSGAPNVEGPIQITCTKCGSLNCSTNGHRIVDEIRVRQFKCKTCSTGFYLGAMTPLVKLWWSTEASELLIDGNSLTRIGDRISYLSRTMRSIKSVKKHQKGLMTYLETYTRNTLYDLEYGSEWEVDETYFRLRSGGMWCTAVLDIKTRLVIAWMITMRRPRARKMTRLLRVAKMYAGTPKIVSTDGYSAYPNALKDAFGENTVRHKVTYVSNGTARHNKNRRRNYHKNNGMDHRNMHIESLWSILKANFSKKTIYDEDWLRHYLRIFMIHYNFVHRHGRLQRDGRNITPAMAGGFTREYRHTAQMFLDALRDPRTVMLQLERE